VPAPVELAVFHLAQQPAEREPVLVADSHDLAVDALEVRPLVGAKLVRTARHLLLAVVVHSPFTVTAASEKATRFQAPPSALGSGSAPRASNRGAVRATLRRSRHPVGIKSIR
jgi:hypothetical protein